MKKALQYLSYNKVRISGFTVVTVDEAMSACELAALEEKEDAAKAFCAATCGEQCPEKHCEKYQAFIDQIGYAPDAAGKNKKIEPPFQDQTLF